MKRRGFTIAELVIVITIMAILLTLGVVNLRGSQANGRDSERRIDIDTIATHLETYYTSGDDSSTSTGQYPTSDSLIGNETYLLRDLDTASLMAPDLTSSSLIVATSASTTAPTLDPSKDQYIYQPLNNSGTLCTTDPDECVKFNLYYTLEVATISTDCPTPGSLCKKTSKHQ